MKATRFDTRWIVGLIAVAFWWLYGWSWLTGPHRLVMRSWVEWVGSTPTKGSNIKEWRLNIPSKFSIDRIPLFRSPAFDPAAVGNDDGRNFVSLSSLLDPSGSVVPYSGAGDRNRSFSIFIANGFVEGSVAQDDYCLTADALHEMRKRGQDRYGIFPLSTCREASTDCFVSLNYHGWPTEAAVARDGLYREPQKVCQILRDTLDAWTISIDELRRTPKTEK